MKHPKSELKQDYYWECKDFYDKLPDQIEVIPSHTEINNKRPAMSNFIESAIGDIKTAIESIGK